MPQKLYYVGRPEDGEYPFYLEDATGYDPAGCVLLDEEDFERYQKTIIDYSAWQDRLKPLYVAARERRRAAEAEASERAELAKLKAKYER